MAVESSAAFAAATNVIPDAPGEFGWQVPDGWQQGKGAWGGLVVGACVNAVSACEPDADRRVRTISAHLYAPAPVGPARLRVRLIRRGSSMSTWAAELLDDSQSAIAEAVVITGSPRAMDVNEGLGARGASRRPRADDWRACDVVPVRPPLGPVFAENLEFRVVRGLPFSQEESGILGWIRFPDQGPWTAAALLGIVDGFWPAVLPLLPGMRPMATVAFSAHLLVDPDSLPAGEPLLYESFMGAAHEGFTTETRRLWSDDGRLVVENLQSVVIIR